MAEWKLHLSKEDNLFSQYQCGLRAGQRVVLRKELVVRDPEGEPTGEVHLAGEVWTVLRGIRSDPVLCFRQPNGQCCTWDDNAESIAEWFERLA